MELGSVEDLSYAIVEGFRYTSSFFFLASQYRLQYGLLLLQAAVLLLDGLQVLASRDIFQNGVA
jgi:hypothetical protein